MVQGHILKFLQKEQPPTRLSKRFRPQETFGHSKQSPDWFKKKFSLKAKGGYEYKFDQPNISQKFKYSSQKHQFKLNPQKRKPFNQQIIGKNAINNRKKGLLSQYLDKNSWMRETIPLNGFQRTQQSRRLNNQDREKNIQIMKQKKSAYIASRTASNFYVTKSLKMSETKSRQIKTSQQKTSLLFQSNFNGQNMNQIEQTSRAQNNHSRSKSITLLMGQKQKIRSQRNSTAFNKIHSIQKMKIQKNKPSNKFKTIDSQFVQERMAYTARQWGSGRKISPYKSIQRFDTMIGFNSTGGYKLANTHHRLLAKKLSSPISEGLNDMFGDNVFLSNQL